MTSQRRSSGASIDSAFNRFGLKGLGGVGVDVEAGSGDAVGAGSGGGPASGAGVGGGAGVGVGTGVGASSSFTRPSSVRTRPRRTAGARSRRPPRGTA